MSFFKQCLTACLFCSLICHKLVLTFVYLENYGLDEFRKSQKVREKLLWVMLDQFNEGRSKSYYCIASTVLEVDELEKAIKEAKNRSKGLDIKEKAKLLHSILDGIAIKNNYYLKLREKSK